jgi:hypothetical protein
MHTCVCVCVRVCVRVFSLSMSASTENVTRARTHTHTHTHTHVSVMFQTATYASIGLSLYHWLHLAGMGRFSFDDHIRNATQYYPLNSCSYFRYGQATLGKVTDYLHVEGNQA